MNYTTDILFLLLGAFFGVFSSGLFWWVQQHYWAPKLAFSPDISKIKNPYTNKGWIYRVKMKNIGKRDIIDIKIYARFSILGQNFKNRKSIDIPLNFNQHPILRKQRNRVIWLDTIPIPPKDHCYFPELFKDGKNTPDFSDFLLYPKKAQIFIYIFGHDSFSGSRKLFKSKKYNYSDIKSGKFSKYDFQIEEDTREFPNWVEK